MYPGLGAGHEQGFEQLSLKIRASALDNDVPMSHELMTKPTPTRCERNGRSGSCLSYLDEECY